MHTNDTPLSFLTVGDLRQIFREEKINEAGYTLKQRETVYTKLACQLAGGISVQTLRKKLAPAKKGSGRAQSEWYRDECEAINKSHLKIAS
jgi:hypothetical protein